MNTTEARNLYLEHKLMFNVAIANKICIELSAIGSTTAFDKNGDIIVYHDEHRTYTVQPFVYIDLRLNRLMVDIITTGDGGMDVLMSIELGEIELNLYQQMVNSTSQLMYMVNK